MNSLQNKKRTPFNPPFFWAAKCLIILSLITTGSLAPTLQAQNVGIGTTTPSNILHVKQPGSISGLTHNYAPGISLTANSPLATAGGPGMYIENTAATSGTRVAKVVNQIVNEGSNNGTFTIQSVSDDAGALYNYIFSADLGTGNVGIGTQTSGAKLEVAGGVKISDSINIGGQMRIMSGTPGAGKVLTSNATGVASWTTPSTPSIPDALPTIQIGTQKWMSKNLDVAFYRNGDPIPQVTDPAAWAGLTTGAWCYYNNDPIQGNKFGKLYNWYAVNDPRGLAPQGWHIPSDAEWTKLETTLGGSSVAGGKMKEPGTFNWTAPNAGADNSSGFAGLPGASRSANGVFGTIGNFGNWWSSTEFNTAFALHRNLDYNYVNINRPFNFKQNGFSVRCLRD